MVDLLDWLGIHLDPKWLSPAYLPLGLQDLSGKVDIFPAGWHFGFDIPAFVIVLLLTVLLVRGIQESARTNNIMVLVKTCAILLFIGFGLSFVKASNYHPFSPNGFTGVLAGGSIIFFTYIGFDSVSTASEECRNPRRDVPIGIIATLIVCTVLYIGVAAVLTGMVPWQSVAGDGAPVVTALKRLSLTPGGHRLHWVRLAVLVGAIVGMVSSILVFQLGQARVWFAMSRDKLLPDVFSQLHPRFRTPAFATWVAGILVAIPSGLFDVGSFCGDVKYRDAVCVCAGVHRGDGAALQGPGAAARVSGAVWAGDPGAEHVVLHPADGRAAGDYLGAVLCVAGDRTWRLLLL